jgi:proliferating cell nuclear antigen
LPSAEFQRICRDLVALSESVNIEVSKGSIKFSSQGDIGNGQVTLKPYDDPEVPQNSVAIELTQGVSLSFSLKYLVNFTKATPLSGSVTLRLLEAMPVLVEYNMEGVGHLQYGPLQVLLTLAFTLRQNPQMKIRCSKIVLVVS